MSGDFALAATSAAVSQILAQHGFHMAEPTAVDLLGEVTVRTAPPDLDRECLSDA